MDAGLETASFFSCSLLADSPYKGELIYGCSFRP